MSDVLFVVGMHRSGTSALTRALSLCGAVLPFDLNPPAADNPTGYWEPLEAIALNDTFLASNGSAWYDASLALQMNPPPAAEREAFVAKIVAFLNELESPKLTAIKDPRISVLLPYWIAAAAKCEHAIKILHIVRSPYEVAASLAARHQLSAKSFLPLWLSYNLIAERDSRAHHRMLLSYDELLSDWEGVVHRCNAKIDLRLSISGAQRAAVSEFLNRELRHHTFRDDEANGTGHGDMLVRRVYALLKSATEGNPDSSAFDSALASVLQQSARLAEEASRENETRCDSLQARLQRAQREAIELSSRVAQIELG